MIYALLGGTGTLGYAVTRQLLTQPDVRLRILARGEHRLTQMQRHFGSDRLSFLVGDVRDQQRLQRALTGVDRVIHMAALKHVNSCEYNVLEAVATNITGSANVVQACIDSGVKQAVLVSSDKAVEPITNYGATKLVAERTFIYGNSYSPATTRFHVVRYGNVLSSQGSLVELWRYQSQQGHITITDPDITRFWWTAGEASNFVLQSFDWARAGDIIVPLMYSCSLGELANLVAPNCRHMIVPRYDIEKDHEVMIAAHEASRTTYIGKLGALRVCQFRDIKTDEALWGQQGFDSSMHVGPNATKAITRMLQETLQ